MNTPFHFTLSGCDGVTAKSVYATFTGVESTSRKGLLAVTDQSTGKLNGIAIGLQTAAGVDIPLDQKVRVADLISGVNEIKLGAYIQAEQALTQNKIVYGQYQVTTNFTLDYQ